MLFRFGRIPLTDPVNLETSEVTSVEFSKDRELAENLK